MDDPYIIKDTGRVNLYSVKDISGKTVILKLSAVFTKIPFAKMYLNTAVTATVIVVVQLILCSMAAYAFGRIKFPGRNIIFGTLLAVLMVPSSFFYPATVSDDTEMDC